MTNPLPTQAKLLPHDFHVVLEGPEDAPVVMLANSLGANLAMWDAQVPALLRHFRVLRYDMRGHGQTPATPGPYSVAQLARDVIDILDAHKIDTVHWIGLSLGGLVGQHLLQLFPQRIGRAVLSNTTAHYPDSAPWNARIATVRTKGLSAIAQGTMERWLSGEFRAAEPAAVEHLKAMLLSTSVDGYIGCAAALRDADLREGLRKVRHEVLVIVGDKDQGTPPEQGWAIANAIPHAQLVTLGAAHISCVEMSDGFNEAVLAFLTAPARARVGTGAATPRRAGRGTAVSGKARRAARSGGFSGALIPIGTTSAKPKKAADKADKKAAKKAAKKLKDEKKLAKAEAKKVKADKAKADKLKAVKPNAVSKTKPIVKSPVVKSPSAKKPAGKKTVVKKAAPKKTAVKKTAVKQTAVKKTAVKKTAPKKTAVKKAAAKKSAAKKSAVQKAPIKKTPAKKTPAKKTATKKAAAKKATPKKR